MPDTFENPPSVPNDIEYVYVAVDGAAQLADDTEIEQTAWNFEHKNITLDSAVIAVTGLKKAHYQIIGNTEQGIAVVIRQRFHPKPRRVGFYFRPEYLVNDSSTGMVYNLFSSAARKVQLGDELNPRRVMVGNLSFVHEPKVHNGLIRMLVEAGINE